MDAPTKNTLVFGRYQVIRRLAVGGMGEIFLARQLGVPGFDRLVVLKTLLPSMVDDAGRIERFLDEARVAATLNHPNIVGVLEVGSHEGTPVIAMEYIAGVSLAEWVEAVDAAEGIPPPMAASIVSSAALALDHAHRATDLGGTPLHIVHRDISPQNIMVRSDGVVKVVDFGIARAANRHARTATGGVHGKLGYMSPEQYRAEPLDGRSDQYSLGVVLWELCAGRRLFRSTESLSRLDRLLTEGVPRLSSARSGVPPTLVEVTARMVSLDRGARFADCAEVATALGDYLRGVNGRFGQADIAAVVEQTCGAAIRDRSDDLSPEPGLAIQGPTPPVGSEAKTTELGGSSTAVDRPHGRSPPADPTRRWIWPTAIGVAGLGLVALLAASHSPEQELSPEPDLEVPIGGATSAPVVPPTPDAPPTAVDPEPGEPARVPTATARRSQPRRSHPPPASAEKQRGVPDTGFLSVRTRPWTQVAVDDRPYGVTPVYKLRLPAGEHSLRLTNQKAGIDLRRRITIVGGDTLKIDEALAP